jgi:hypothetical protein
MTVSGVSFIRTIVCSNPSYLEEGGMIYDPLYTALFVDTGFASALSGLTLSCSRRRLTPNGERHLLGSSVDLYIEAAFDDAPQAHNFQSYCDGANSDIAGQVEDTVYDRLSQRVTVSLSRVTVTESATGDGGTVTEGTVSGSSMEGTTSMESMTRDNGNTAVSQAATTTREFTLVGSISGARTRDVLFGLWSVMCMVVVPLLA